MLTLDLRVLYLRNYCGVEAVMTSSGTGAWGCEQEEIGGFEGYNFSAEAIINIIRNNYR